MSHSRRRKLEGVENFCSGVAFALIVPVMIFIVVFYTRSFSIHYWAKEAHYAICCIMLLPILMIGLTGCCKVLSQSGDAAFLILTCLLSLSAWGFAFHLGNVNFVTTMEQYYYTVELQNYSSVDPARYRGNQFMDAAQLDFLPGSALDLTLSYGFKNDETYCIAPIVGPSRRACIGSNTSECSNVKMDHYDFWAVGTNCCSGHTADYNCGEVHNPMAHKGLRLMKADQRDFFNLAVMEAEVAYNIKAKEPIFLYWMENPQNMVEATRSQGIWYFAFAVSACFAANVNLVLLAGCTMMSRKR
jgi:hypothetical protein